MENIFSGENPIAPSGDLADLKEAAGMCGDIEHCIAHRRQHRR